MKLVRNLVATLLLMFALGVSTYAGDLETPGYTPPPPIRPTSVATDDTIAPDPSASAYEVKTESDLLLDVLIAALSVF